MGNIIRRISAFFVDIIETVVISLSIFLVVYLFLVQPHQVSGLSMFPSFHDKEYILTDKVTYRLSDPKRGDVVVFHAPDRAQCPKGTGCDFIKRVVGLPGETVQIINNKLYVNDKALDESSYLAKDVLTNPEAFIGERQVQLGENQYFVVGDNRPHSSDSRQWGPIGKEEIVGRGFLRYWPPPTFGLIPKASYKF